MTDNKKIRKWRADAEHIRAKYDCGAMPEAVQQVLRNIEQDIAWEQARLDAHHGQSSKR